MPETTTIRIGSAFHRALKEMAAQTGNSLQSELEKAISQRHRTSYLEGLKDDYAVIEQSPRTLRKLKKEIELWDTAADDGLNSL